MTLSIFQEYHKSLTESTLRSKLFDLRSFARYLGVEESSLLNSTLLWENLPNDTMSEYVDWMIDEGLAPSTIRRRVANLRAYLKIVLLLPHSKVKVTRMKRSHLRRLLIEGGLINGEKEVGVEEGNTQQDTLPRSEDSLEEEECEIT